MDSILRCDDIADLDNLINAAEEEIGFEHGRIQVFNDDEGTYGIEIDGHDYSTYIPIEEAESTIRDLFNGIKLVSKQNSMEEHDYLSQEKFDEVKAKLRQMLDDGWEVPKMVACIYDLFQEYIISETQEQILYQIADPFEDYNECSEYWHEMDYDNPLLQILR